MDYRVRFACIKLWALLKKCKPVYLFEPPWRPMKHWKYDVGEIIDAYSSIFIQPRQPRDMLS